MPPEISKLAYRPSIAISGSSFPARTLEALTTRSEVFQLPEAVPGFLLGLLADGFSHLTPRLAKV